jgi:hypothetical protein
MWSAQEVLMNQIVAGSILKLCIYEAHAVNLSEQAESAKIFRLLAAW